MELMSKWHLQHLLGGPVWAREAVSGHLVVCKEARTGTSTQSPAGLAASRWRSESAATGRRQLLPWAFPGGLEVSSPQEHKPGRRPVPTPRPYSVVPTEARQDPGA